jgi:hypothetical protein
MLSEEAVGIQNEFFDRDRVCPLQPAASEGPATVVRGLIGREALAERMDLQPDPKIVLAQPVGYPSEEELYVQGSRYPQQTIPTPNR